MKVSAYLSLIVASTFLSGMISCAVSKNSDGLSMNPTIYYKPTIRQKDAKCASSATRDILTVDGVTLATLCEKDYDACLMQGSCFVDDGIKVTSYNYHSTKDQVARFMEVDLKKCPYGYGVRSSCLDPYFSVAADLSIYKAGEVLFIPRLVGAVLPNGEVHDGFIIIRDSGGGIIGANRFDFFTGFYDHRQKANTLARLGFGEPKNRFEFRKATAEETLAAQKSRNYPGLKESVLAEGQHLVPSSQ